MGRADEVPRGISTNQSPMLQWDSIDWGATARGVERLQQKIFRDARAGNLSRMRKWQKLLVRSLSARLLAVKVVPELNGGSEDVAFILFQILLWEDMATCDVHLEPEPDAAKVASQVLLSRGGVYPP